MIKDLILVDLKIINDKRGDILHMLRNDDKNFTSFGECYISEVNPHRIKAWKLHLKQTQILTVVYGQLKFVFYDLRKESSTYGKIMELNLSRDANFKRLHIPPNIYYGFQNQTDDLALIVNCTNTPHDISESKKIDFDSDLIPFKWNKYD
jgi:dTDP-4-dehydrorhamnose 3,5-epimerase